MNKIGGSKTNRKKRTDILIRLSIIMVIITVLFLFVIKPMINKDYYFDTGMDYTFKNIGSAGDKDSFDVAIAGDGIDAYTAALGAAKVGAKTVLICSSGQLGEEFRKSMNVSWYYDISPVGVNMSSDIFKEIRYKSGEGSNIENYIKTIGSMISEEKKLTVLYNTRLVDAAMENGGVTGLKLSSDTGERNIKALRYIDSTWDGELLKMCRAEYTTGYSDIGIENLYTPVRLNFMVSGVDYQKLLELQKKQGTMLNLILKSYRPADSKISISGFNITDQGDSNVIIEALTMKNVNTGSSEELEKAYEKVSRECTDFYNYLKLNVDPFKTATGMKIAEKFEMSSPVHYIGKYRMTLSDVLTGKRYTDRISTAVRPVTFTNVDGNRYLLCNPKIFYVPLSSIIPLKLNNVLMTGDKISSSALVQTAINSNSSMAGTGFAAGIIAAYSISEEMDIPQIIEDNNQDIQLEVERILRKMGIFMSDIKENLSGLTENWSYSYAEKLINLGLLSGGITNDFKYDKEAQAQDFAYIILNGVPRVSADAYNYDFDLKVRKYLTTEPLSGDILAYLLLELNGYTNINGNYYLEACQKGLIDDTLQAKLKSGKILKFPEVYYASVKTIEKLTGKKLK